jgi:hypothetical protein
VKAIQLWYQVEEYFIVDSSGTRYDLEDPRPKGRAWSPVKRVALRILNPIVEIEYGKITERGRLSLADIKALVTRDIDANADYWVELEEPGILKERVERTRDIEGLFRLFAT